MAKSKEKVLSVAVRNAVANARKIVAAWGTMRDKVEAVMLKQYPSKKAYLSGDWDAHRAFLAALRNEDGTVTKCYAYACAWLTDTYGGLRTRDGSLKNGKHGKTKLTAGVFVRTLITKFESTVDYIARVPKDDIEPAMFESLNEICEHIASAWALLEAYREMEKDAANDEASAVALVKAKADIAAKQSPGTKAKIQDAARAVEKHLRAVEDAEEKKAA